MRLVQMCFTEFGSVCKYSWVACLLLEGFQDVHWSSLASRSVTVNKWVTGILYLPLFDSGNHTHYVRACLDLTCHHMRFGATIVTLDNRFGQTELYTSRRTMKRLYLATHDAKLKSQNRLEQAHYTCERQFAATSLSPQQKCHFWQLELYLVRKNHSIHFTSILLNLAIVPYRPFPPTCYPLLFC